MNKNINKRVAELRLHLRKNGLAAYIFPSTDPHHSEYPPEYWKTREWISGFNGSAGTAVVTSDDAALWTDSRYFIAAEEQLKDTPFRLMKERLEARRPSRNGWRRFFRREAPWAWTHGSTPQTKSAPSGKSSPIADCTLK